MGASVITGAVVSRGASVGTGVAVLRGAFVGTGVAVLRAAFVGTGVTVSLEAVVLREPASVEVEGDVVLWEPDPIEDQGDVVLWEPDPVEDEDVVPRGVVFREAVSVGSGASVGFGVPFLRDTAVESDVVWPDFSVWDPELSGTGVLVSDVLAAAAVGIIVPPVFSSFSSAIDAAEATSASLGCFLQDESINIVSAIARINRFLIINLHSKKGRQYALSALSIVCFIR